MNPFSIEAIRNHRSKYVNGSLIFKLLCNIYRGYHETGIIRGRKLRADLTHSNPIIF